MSSNELIKNNKNNRIFHKSEQNSFSGKSENPLYNVPLTKFLVPYTGSRQIRRDSLIEKFSGAVQKKLTMVTAPAGYGKSTLVSNWIYSKDISSEAIWIALDRQDSEEISFWHNLLYGIQQKHNSCLYGDISKLSPEQSINLIINHFSGSPSDSYIIFDDFHNIDYTLIKNAFEYFLMYLPKNLHCIIISRCLPEVSISKMMVDDEVEVINNSDLRFTIDETRIYLNEIMQLNIFEEDIKALELITEGWAAAIKVAALSMINGSDKEDLIQNFNMDSNKMFNYILEEVINYQSPEVTEFLIKTAFLRNLNKGLCTSVTGFANSQEILETLERNNFFIFGLDDRRNNYRYHSLLSDVLLKLLNKRRSDEVKDLYLSASSWYQVQGDYNEALEYSIQAVNPDSTLGLLEEYYCTTKSNSLGPKRICECFETIPHEMYRDNPEICINYALALTETGRVSLDEKELTERGIDLNSKVFENYRGKVYQMRVNISLKHENLTEVINYSFKALEQLPENDTSRVLLYLILGFIYRSAGDINKAGSYFNDAVSSSEKASESFILSNFYMSSIRFLRGESDKFIDDMYKMLEENITHKNCMYFCLASALYDFGELQKANDYVLKGLELCNTYEDIFYERVKGLSLLAKILIHTDRSDEAVIKLNEIDKLIKPDSGNMFILLELPKIVNALVMTGLTDRAERYIDKFKALNCREAEFNIIEAEAELFYARGNFWEAIDRLEFILNNMGLECYPKKRMDILIFLAAAYKADGKNHKALENLKRALEIKDAEKYFRSFLDRGITLDLIKKVNSNFPGGKHRNIEGQLSEREMDVLRLLSEGYSYNEIGNKLFITLSTVKKHTGNIYYKLDAGNRMQAVIVAKEKKLVN